MFLYVAPFVGIAFLGAIWKAKNQFGLVPAFKQLVNIGLVVIMVSAVSLYPFLDSDFSTLSQLHVRLFPFKRGVTHAYWAGNFWALYNVADWILSKIFGVSSNLTSGLVGEFSHQVLSWVYKKLF